MKTGEIFLIIILALASIWDGFTTVYGTLEVLGGGPLQFAAALLFSGLILGFVLNTGRIFRWRSTFLSGLMKFFWFVALCYDFITTWIAHTHIVITGESFTLIQVVMLVGLTLLVTGSPILVSALWERKFNRGELKSDKLEGIPNV